MKEVREVYCIVIVLRVSLRYDRHGTTTVYSHKCPCITI